MSLQEKNGIYFSNKEKSTSYSADGNDFCYQIEDNSFWFKYRNQIILKFVSRPKHPMAESFIDIGGGNGFVAREIQNQGFETTLLEPSKGVFNAKRRGIKNIYCCTLEELPQEFKYDNAGIFDVLEHIENPVEYLKLISSHLKENGTIYITVPAYIWLWSSADVIAGHKRRYTTSDIIKELSEAGFDLSYSTYFFSFLIVPIWLFSTVPDFISKALGRNPSVLKRRQQLTPSKNNSFLLNLLTTIESLYIDLFGKSPLGSSIFIIAKKRSSTRIEKNIQDSSENTNSESCTK